jgi:hypothetical protein
MFIDIIKSSKALEMLAYKVADNSGRDKPLSKIELHLVEQAENFLTDQMRELETSLSKSPRRIY